MACPTAGLLLTLIGWGALADRRGERVVLASGLGLAGLVLAIGSVVHSAAGLGLCLALAGAAGGSVFAASGRLILGWFARHERGSAMGIRQSAQPLGVALAAATLPALGRGGTARPLVFLASFCLVAAILVVLLVQIRIEHERENRRRKARVLRRRARRLRARMVPSRDRRVMDPRTDNRCSGAYTPRARCW